jgi:hypothetical protein
MTGAAHLTAPPPGVTGWVVSIDMPRFETGKRSGELTGWLDMNKPPDTTRKKIEHTEIRRLWRQAAKVAYARKRLPRRTLDRVFVLVQFQFRVGDGKHDQPNLEPTLKPIMDALQPERVVVIRKKNPRTGRVELDTQVHLGWGVIPDDGDEHLVRGQQQPKLPPLDRNSPIGGRVVLHIIPFPHPTTNTE